MATFKQSIWFSLVDIHHPLMKHLIGVYYEEYLIGVYYDEHLISVNAQIWTPQLTRPDQI